MRQICPSEESCEIFQSAAGKNRRQKERNACVDGHCPAFPTKYRADNQKEATFFENLIEECIWHKVTEGRKPIEFTAFEMIAMTLIDAEWSRRRIRLQIDQLHYLKRLAG